VFIFAGGTSWSFAEFSPRQDTPPTEAQRAAMGVFRLRKGPDFVSRLDAFMDVLGPNPRSLLDEAGERKVDPDDVGYPLRRALLIRAYLGCRPADRVDFDPDLLHALLRVSRYRHGARSLEKLMDLLRGASWSSAAQICRDRRNWRCMSTSRNSSTSCTVRPES